MPVTELAAIGATVASGKTGAQLLALGLKKIGKEAFGKAVGETLSRFKTATQSAINKRKTERIIANFYNHLTKVRLVKTLWQVDKAVDIGTFYCESHVYVKTVRTKIVCMEQLHNLGNLVIQGIAGQ